MKSSIKKILFPYQIEHTENLVNNLSERHICFDTSDTGTGKTYTAIASAKILKMNVFILCPKTIISLWQSIADKFNVKCVGISNYELIIRGSHYYKNKKKQCDYVKDNEWNIPPNTLIIIDEAHKCSNPTSLIGQLTLNLKNTYGEKNPLLLISATICDGAHKFRLFGELLKWFPNCISPPHWLEKTYNPKHSSVIIKERLNTINLCRISISDLGDMFHKNTVTADFYDISSTVATTIDGLHHEILKSLDKLQRKKDGDNTKTGFVTATRNRQKIELLKIPIFVELVDEYLNNNFSVIIFINYTETLNILAKKLKTNCLVYGEQTLNERLKNIKDFVDDKQRVIICNINCGGQSISLNDINGVYKRVSLINPPLSSISLIQACGRNNRADSKSNSFNKIIYANTQIERELCSRIKEKCSMYNTINDADLFYEID